MKKKASLKDIAEYLGVSKTLVSMVLNGKGKDYRINEDVCKKVIETAKELNYQPNQMAKGLRTGKTNSIGLVIADIANPFFGKLGREIEIEASAKGYRVMFGSSDENVVKFKQQIALLEQGQVDGFILSPPVYSEKVILALESKKIPYVLIDRYFPEIDSDYIVVDNFDAARAATELLIKNGRKRVANLTLNVDLINMQDRTEGYKQGLMDAGIEVDEALIKILPFSHETAEVYNAIKELILKHNIDAILFSTSKIGVMGIEILNEMGVKIPEQIAVASFDNLDAFKICHPPVTAIAQPLKSIGKTAVEFLIEQIEKANFREKQHCVLNTELIVRKSCGS